jgi:hypothetical protein
VNAQCLECGQPSRSRVGVEAHLLRRGLQLFIDSLGRPPEATLNQAINRLIEIEQQSVTSA